MCMLPDDESQWITITIRWLRELGGKNYFCSLQALARDAQTSDVHHDVVGVALEVTGAEEEVDVGSLLGYLDHFSMLRVVLFIFHRYEGLLVAVEHHRPLSFNPRPVIGQGCIKFLEVPVATNSSLDYDYVEIDPITLTPTGRSWAYKSGLDLGLLLIQESLQQTGHIPDSALT
ncbi:hypothetical protein BDY19DRAFT_905134 [Irpex rosettiformis]|uniref:Uncharacterized protein n=1 Tax=Irpex rosettiformis TaxID=378272 RepID=A0ACB8U6Q9_9APHY|nr:hypothetical protein BDY19DRAFT_905134 [Irpex rosettiformis]